jgi:hypothetical protein
MVGNNWSNDAHQWLTEQKTIEKPLVPMIEHLPFHQWQWSPEKPLIWGDGCKFSAFMYGFNIIFLFKNQVR